MDIDQYYIFDHNCHIDWVIIAEFRQFHGFLGMKQENPAKNIQLVFVLSQLCLHHVWEMLWVIELPPMTHSHYFSKFMMIANKECLLPQFEDVEIFYTEIR